MGQTSNGKTPELAVGFRYKVSIQGDGMSESESFSEISGLSVELETESLFAGGENNFAYYLPKQIKNTPLVLKRGLFNKESELLKWIKDVLINGFPKSIKTQDIVIQLMNDQNEPIIIWTLHDAFPVKWDVNGFNSMENKLVVESVTLNYSNFEMEFK